MAARKKAKSKTQRKTAPVRKPAARKKTAPVKKKVARKKAPARRAAPKKNPAARPAVAKRKVAAPAAPAKKKVTAPPAPVRKSAPLRKPTPARPAPPPRPAATSAPTAPAAAPAPLANEERIGTVTHYYSHLSVAVVRLESGMLRAGDTIHVTGHTSDFRQPVESLQIEHQPVSEVSAGQEFGLRVIDHAREHDAVYKVKA